ncbi:hypothetical protein [Xanthomarina spongicola]|uniref:Uncharacterized protein n=1 Tax=Xanthomarina spongicola TaxID=570520 RepID=A0A316DRC5_9FLAO|nr:hypothetical protein [Xanthomarina spongicola]PWK20028.1 hypothetical protein LX78_01379 [Xanthomarina spongicola]
MVLAFTGCKTISVQDNQYQTAKEQIVLGSIGQDANYLLEQHYSSSAIPNYITPIKVQATAVPFNKSSYKSFQQAQPFQTTKVQIKYVDSLELKPSFINLEIVDQVGLITLLNDKTNADIKEYLVNQTESHIVTYISMAFPENILKDLQDAEEVFIEPSGKKSIALHLYKEKELIKIVNFFEGVVFAYKTASCCWKENDKYQLEIVDLVDANDNCPNKSYLSAQNAKKEINYYKF